MKKNPLVGDYLISDLEPLPPKIICGASAGKCERVVGTIYQDDGGPFLAYGRAEWSPTEFQRPWRAQLEDGSTELRYPFVPDEINAVHEHFNAADAPAVYRGLWCREHRFRELERVHLVEAFARRKRVILARPQRS